MSLIESHLGRAIISTLKRLGVEAENGWVTRSVLSEELLRDEWVSRNQHRLSRLDSTVAGLAREDLLEIDGERLRLARLEVAAERVEF